MSAKPSMNEADDTAPDARPPGAASDADSSAGAMLRGAREKAGLHIGALAVSLRIPVNKLEALEADRLDLLPDVVFARALASTVCRALKLDPGPVLRKLPDQAIRRLKLDVRLGTASFDTPGMGWRLPLLSRLSKPAVITVAVLLVAALVIVLVPSLELSKTPSAPAREAAAAGGAPGTSIGQAIPAAPLVTTASSARPSVAPVAPVVAAAPTPPAGPVASANTGPSATASDQKAGAALSALNLVVFKARGSSWVEVTDANGVVQLRKTMAAGDAVSASGTVPLSVIVGRVDSTEVLVRGKSFDLAASTKDNVARFQIK